MRKAHSATATRWLNLSASTPWTDLQKMTNALRTRTVRHWRLCQRAKRRRRCRRAARMGRSRFFASERPCAARTRPASWSSSLRSNPIRPRQRLPSQPEDSARSVTYRLRCRDRCHQQQLWQHSWPSGYRCWGCQLPPQARGPAAAAGSGAPVVLSEFGRAAARPHSRGVRKNCPPIELERRRAERLGGLPSREAEDVLQDQDGL